MDSAAPRTGEAMQFLRNLMFARHERNFPRNRETQCREYFADLIRQRKIGIIGIANFIKTDFKGNRAPGLPTIHEPHCIRFHHILLGNIFRRSRISTNDFTRKSIPALFEPFSQAAYEAFNFTCTGSVEIHCGTCLADTIPQLWLHPPFTTPPSNNCPTMAPAIMLRISVELL